MAVFTSQRSGSWSRTSNNADSPWYDAGTQTALATIPRDNTDSVVLAAGHIVLMDDATAYADPTSKSGLLGMTIQGHATAPGELKFASGSNGFLRIKTGNTIIGTAGACRGRISASHTGKWIGCNAYAVRGSDGVVAGNADRTFTPATSPQWPATGNPAQGETIMIGGSPFVIDTHDATTVLTWTGAKPAAAASTGAWSLVVRPVVLANSARIALGATSKIDAQYIDIAMHGVKPEVPYIRTYGQVFAGCTITPGSPGTITYGGSGGTGMYPGVVVTFTPDGGALPPELVAGVEYFVVNSSGTATFQVALTYNGAAIALSAGGSVHCHLGYLRKWQVIAGNKLQKLDVAGNPMPHALAAGCPVILKSSSTYPTVDGDASPGNKLFFVQATGDPLNTRETSITLCDYNTGAVTAPPVTITGEVSGQLDIYTGSLACSSAGFPGTFKTTCTKMNVLDDVTGYPTSWAPNAATWANTTARNAVALVGELPGSPDLQANSITAITPTLVTLSAAVDSTQYPNSKLWMASMNVAINFNHPASSAWTSSNWVVDYTQNTTSAGVFACGFRATAWTTGSGNGFAVANGRGHTVDGVFAGCYTGVTGIELNVSGFFLGGTYPFAGQDTWTSYGHVFNLVGAGVNSCVMAVVGSSGTATAYGVTNVVSNTASSTVTVHGNAAAYVTTGVNGCTINGEFRNAATSIFLSSGCAINAALTGGSVGIGTSCSGTIVTGTIRGYVSGVAGSGVTVNGPITACGVGVGSGSQNTVLLSGAVLSNNSTGDLNIAAGSVEGWGATLSSLVPNYSYRSFTMGEPGCHCLYDYAGVKGNIRAWMPGGTVVTVSDLGAAPLSSAPGGITRAYRHDGLPPWQRSVQRDVFLDIPLYAKAGVPLNIVVYEKCETAPSTFISPPTWHIVDADAVYGSGYLATASAVDAGDDTNWHTLRLSYTPTRDGLVLLRSRAKAVEPTIYGGPGGVLFQYTFTPSVSPGWVVDSLAGKSIAWSVGADSIDAYNILASYTVTNNTESAVNGWSLLPLTMNVPQTGTWWIIGKPLTYHWMYRVESENQNILFQP